ncbi:hypothetical protein [Streptomyces spinosisporus]|uniref:DUF11 domain-containing protein n=1 Tax=Streptomyces spinosisporus TaxID=2927582 RepID=A0ABS9XGV8_9ACTN|nr:hypothetical protein [Streptomyces spinosisporus]MCI3241233.1 hypothetical protein [Streptomyces spinosisporus]
MRRRRCFTRLALTGALLLGALTACTGDEKAFSLSAPEIFYVPTNGGKKVFPLRVDGPGSYAPGARRLTVDVEAGSEGAVRLRDDSTNCRGSATHVVCEGPAARLLGLTTDAFAPLPAKGSKPGDTGYLRLTYVMTDGEKLTARTRVVVGEPVLELLTPAPDKGVRPGAEVTYPVVVRNTGDVTVRGLALVVNAGDLAFVQRHANCRYPDLQHGSQAVCSFPGVRIAPGKSVAVRPALRLRASRTTMYGSFGRMVWPLKAGPGPNQTVSEGGEHGDGPALRAEAVKTPHGRFTKAGDFVDVRLATGADYAVSGADLHGDPGDTRKVGLTVRNNGPGNPGYTTRLVFSPPPGTDVLKEPMTEIDDGVYEPYCDNDGYTYTCDVQGLDPGKAHTFEFTLRLGEPSTGSVRLEDQTSGPTASPAPGGASGRHDPDASNDKASVVVTG